MDGAVAFIKLSSLIMFQNSHSVHIKINVCDNIVYILLFQIIVTTL